ncbi:esterase [Celerinatantimonas sp. YJH-8]|uniref:esterase n=1 Tax=Celerinatantimonas sp. YJH-8 TaxID=3228714 RepID=UPI0038C2B9F5
MTQSIVVQQPVVASGLILLLHGVGANARGMQEIGEYLAHEFPDSAVIAVNSPDPCDLGSGFQWFSVQGVTEANRPARIAATMGRFEQMIQYWQQQTQVDASQTTLIGFSQGAIMALESAKQQTTALAGRIVSLSGRFAALPQTLVHPPRFLFLHGQQDPVIDVQYAHQAVTCLQQQSVTVESCYYPGMGHQVSAAELSDLVTWLSR